MKRRWAAATAEQGLVRESAAWFVSPPCPDRVALERTLAATVYLALSPGTRERLAAMTRPGAYAEFFSAAAELLPAVLLFVDEPTGREQWHRYAWHGAPGTGSTFPYTKVARASRRVDLRHRDHHVVEVDMAMAERAEAVADATSMSATGPIHLTRIPANALEPAPPSSAPCQKLTCFCAGLAVDLRAATSGRISRMLCEVG
jgi:hypothetical protein